MKAPAAPLGILSMLAVLTSSVSLHAQNSPPPSAAMLRRVAEAIDAQRDGRRVWVVLDSVAPYYVFGVFHAPDSAGTLAERRRGTVVLGPYLQPPDPGTTQLMMAVLPCPGRHDMYSYCPDTTRTDSTVGYARSAAPPYIVPASEVDSIVLTVYDRHATPGMYSLAFRPQEADAFFLTLSAIDKFAMPYYTRVYGATVAAEWRAAYVRKLSGHH